MIGTLIRNRRWVAAAALVVLVAVGVLVVNGAAGGDETVVIYNGRSHYGTEQVFRDFQEETGIEVLLRGGSASELFQRLRSEGEDTPADLLVTTDLARLWRAQQAGLLEGVTTPELRAHIPPELHAPDGQWWALTTRLRIPVVSTERVPEGAVAGYAALGDPRFEGRTCLRTSTSEYNQSLVADLIAKRGREATAGMLRSWMANDPDVLGSDGELLAAIAAGDCDVGLSNHYYLGRALKENPRFPVRPAWPNQDGAGAHQNVSGVGLVRWSDVDEQAIRLMEYLTSERAQEQIASRSEFAANPDAAPPEHIAPWADVETDPIDVREAGPLLDEATGLMLEVGWE